MLGSAKGGKGRGRRTVVDLTIAPDTLDIAVGMAASFAAAADLSDGSTSSRPAVTWSATGGTIDATGKFTAGRIPGRYAIRATAANGVADTAAVDIMQTTPMVIGISLSPTSISLPVGASKQFVTLGKAGDGTSVAVSPKYAATGGTITSDGVYTAGQTAGTFRVVALDTSSGLADTSAVVVDPLPAALQAVVLNPGTASLTAGGTQQFAAMGVMSDSSTSSVTVTWSASGGTISSTGLYTAGSVAGTYRVIGTQTGGSLADTAVVTVAAQDPTLQAVVLTPASAALQTGATQQFAAKGQMSDGSITTVNVTYSATGGTITSSGNYTAGSVAGSYRVIATQNGGTLADTASVSVTTPSPSSPPSSSCLRTVNVSTMASLTTALNAALPGDCILMAAGTYGATANLTFNRSGTAANPVVIEGPGSSAVLDMNQRQPQMTASYVRLRKFRMTDLPGVGFWFHGATGVVLDSMELDHSGQEMLKLVDASHDNVIKNSWFHHTGQLNPQFGEGIYVSNSGVSSSVPFQTTNINNQILNNRFGPNITAAAIDMKAGADRTTIRGNTFDGTGTTVEDGAHILVASSYNVIDNNTVLFGKPNGFGFYVSQFPMVGNLITNNFVDLQNILHLSGGVGFNFTVNTNNATANTFKCSNTIINGALSNMACAP
jgi:hypothetical protein